MRRLLLICWGLLFTSLFFPFHTLVAAQDLAHGWTQSYKFSDSISTPAAYEADSTVIFPQMRTSRDLHHSGKHTISYPLDPLPIHGVPGSALSLLSSETGPPFQISGKPVYYGLIGYLHFHPAVAFNGENYLVSWIDTRAEAPCIYAARISTSGKVLDPGGILVCVVDVPENSIIPAVASDGANFLIVWHAIGYPGSDYDIQGLRVSGTGEVLDSRIITISNAPNDQLFPSVAFDGTNFLVVWHDKRSGSDSDIYASRVTTSGVVLEGDGFPVSTAALAQRLPALVFNGTDYFVVWEDYRNGVDYDIYGTRISRAAEVLDCDGIQISAAAGDQRFPAVGFGDGQHLLVWSDYREDTNGDIYATRVSTSGHVIDSMGIEISASASAQSYPCVTFSGSLFITAWTDDPYVEWPDVCYARVSSDGVVLDTSRTVISTLHSVELYPVIAFDGNNCLVAWEDRPNGLNSQIACALVNSSGLVDSLKVWVSTAANYEVDPVIASDSTNYLVAWVEDRGGAYDIYGARVDWTGQVLDTTSLAICGEPGTQNHPGVASDGSDYLVVWADGRNIAYGNIYGTLVSRSGEVADIGGELLSPTSAYQGYPVVAFGGENYLVAYEENRGYPFIDIYGVRVNSSGEVLDSVGIPISVYNPAELDPDVASNGKGYLVAYRVFCDEYTPEWYCGLYVAHVDAAGNVVDRRKIGPQESLPRIASDGTNYLVVWAGVAGDPCRICGIRLSESGIPIDNNIIVISPTGYCCPDVEFDGVNYRVVWEEDRPGTWLDVMGARVSPDGHVLEPYEVAISADDFLQRSPTLAKGPNSSCLVTYSSFTPLYGSVQIWGNIWHGSTGLTFASASATGKDGYVYLSWQMGIDVNASVFVVRRSESPDGQYNVVDVPIIEGAANSFSCNDHSVIGGRTYWYKIVLTNLSYQEEYGPIEALVEAVPTVYRVSQSYPNPFNPSCTIQYELPRAGMTSLRVFDVSGSLVRTLVDGWKETGIYAAIWDGRAHDGSKVPSGIYFYEFRAGDFAVTRKMVLLR